MITKPIGKWPGGGHPLTAAATLTPTSELFALAHRTILVTGGVRGLGLAVAVSLLESGADVVVFDRLSPEDPGASGDWGAALGIAEQHGAQLSWASLDVTDAAAVDAAVAAAFASARPSHPVRGLFNSAGIQHLEAAVDVPPALWRRVLDINLTGSFLVSAAFARAYAQGRGQENLDRAGASIVLVASMSGRVANRGLQCAAYNASKAGVVQLARNLAMEWGPQGIRVNVGRPGAR